MKSIFFLIAFLTQLTHAFSQVNKLDSLLPTALEVEAESAKSLFLEAEKLASTEKDQAEINFYKLYWYSNYNQFDSAVKVGEIALSKFIELKDTGRIVKTRHKLMVDYVRMGWFEEALAQNQASFDWAELVKDTSEIIHYYSDFGFIYHDFKQYKKGISYSKKALPIIKNYTNASPGNYIDIYEMIAINFDDWGKQDSAIYYHKKAIAFNSKLNDEGELKGAYNNIGNSLIKKGEFEKAKIYIDKALDINLLNGSDYDLATNYTNLGTIAYQLGNYSEADNYFTKALYYSKASQSVEKMLDVYQQLYLYHKITD